MTTTRRLVLAALVVLVAPASGATLTPPERRCQGALAGAGRQLLDRTMTILAGCQHAVARGTLPAATDCLTNAATTQARATMAAKLEQRIRQACASGAASLAPGGDCAGARTPNALAGCIHGSHDADAVALIGAANASSGPLADPVLSCQEEASRQARAFTLARLGVLRRCKRRPPRDLPPGSECRTAPRVVARLADLHAAAVDRITARCSDTALAGARFGVPCAAPTSGASLAD